jgi:hypothetical protein
MGYLVLIGANIDLMTLEFDAISNKEEISFSDFVEFMDKYYQVLKREQE